MIVDFGKHKDKQLEDIPEDYLCWLAKPRYSGAFYKNSRTTEKNWKVPFKIQMAARKIIMDRGYVIIGERVEKP